RISGVLQPTEGWFEARRRFVEKWGTHLTLDDGKSCVSYSERAPIAFVRESRLAKTQEGFTGAVLLSRLSQRAAQTPGVRLTRTGGTTADGRRVTVIETVDNS